MIVLGIVILILVILIYTNWISTCETYKPCNGSCSNTPPKGGILLINPFVLPYSGTQCVDSLYSPSSAAPLTHQNIPDHVELV